MRVNLSSVLELLGATLLLFASWAWDWRASVALIGVACLAVSFVVDAPEVDR